MPNRLFAVRIGLIALLAASLACNAVTNALGGGNAQKDAQATADAVLTEAASQLNGVEATAEENFPTAEATLDLGNLDTPEVSETEAGGTDNGGEATATEDTLGFGTAPADIPVMTTGTNENMFASEALVSYISSEAFEDVASFYKDQMPANDWKAVPESSIETTDAVILTYDKPDRTAIVTLSVDTTSKKTVVLVTIAQK